MIDFFTPAEAVTMDNFNQRLRDIKASLPEQNLKIFTGSYVGTGNGGVNFPNSLSFSFAPKILIITRPDNAYNSFMFCIAGSAYAGSINFYYSASADPFNGRNVVTFKNNGNTIEWYNDNYSSSIDMAVAQLNASLKTYMYFAIGA